MRFLSRFEMGTASTISAIISKSAVICLSWPSRRLRTAVSSSSRILAIFTCEEDIRRRLTNARTTSTLIVVARSDLRTFAAMTEPCSVKAMGALLTLRLLDAAAMFGTIEAASLRVKEKAKSLGNLRRFRRSCRLSCFVDTPYSRARSESRMTLWPRTTRMSGRATGRMERFFTLCIRRGGAKSSSGAGKNLIFPLQSNKYHDFSQVARLNHSDYSTESRTRKDS